MIQTNEKKKANWVFLIILIFSITNNQIFYMVNIYNSIYIRVEISRNEPNNL